MAESGSLQHIPTAMHRRLSNNAEMQKFQFASLEFVAFA
jgi:hypothetical protein